MTRTSTRIIWIATLALFFDHPVALAAEFPKPSEVTLLRTLNRQLMDWFYSLSGSFDVLADSEDRRALRIRLVDLNKAVYDLESKGRSLRASISRKPVVYEDVTRSISDTRAALSTVANRLHSVGLSLRMEYRKGGAEAERLIAEATSRRSLWLSDLEAAVANRNISPQLVREGTDVLNMQGTASMALSEVIEKLGKAEAK